MRKFVLAFVIMLSGVMWGQFFNGITGIGAGINYTTYGNITSGADQTYPYGFGTTTITIYQDYWESGFNSGVNLDVATIYYKASSSSFGTADDGTWSTKSATITAVSSSDNDRATFNFTVGTDWTAGTEYMFYIRYTENSTNRYGYHSSGTPTSDGTTTAPTSSAQLFKIIPNSSNAYHTIRMDGTTIDWYGTTTQIATRSTGSASRTFDITWDETYIYFLFNSGFSAAAFNRIHIGFDVNPGSGGDANGTKSFFGGATFPENYRPDYIFRASGSGSNTWVNDRGVANGSNGWTYTGNIGNSSSSDVQSVSGSDISNLEMRVKRSALGSFTSLGVFVWFSTNGDALYDSYPHGNPSTSAVMPIQIYLPGLNTSTSPTGSKTFDAQYEAADFTLFGIASYGNLKISNTSSKVYRGSLTTVTGNLTIDASAHFSMEGTNTPITVYGNFSNSGTMTLGSYIHPIGGDLKLKGNYAANGTLNANGRAIFFTGDNVTQVFSSTGTKTIPYFVIGENSKPVTVQISDVDKLILSGPNGGNTLSFDNANCILDLNDLDLEIGTSGLTSSIQGSGKIKAGTNSDITLQGALGTDNATNLGTLTFDPAGNTINSLTINRTSSAFFNLGSALTVNGSLTISSGDLDLNGNTITLGSSATLSETAGNTVKGTTGVIQTTRTLNNISAENVAGLGATITTAANMGSTTIVRGHAAQTGNSNSGILRYYDITPTTNTGLNATLVFNYDDSELNGKTESSLVLFKSTNSGTNWTNMGGAVDISANTITLTGITGFSRWTASGSDAPLPVELTSFTARITGTNVKLNWSTASEIDNFGFEIERTLVTEGQDNTFSKIGFVEGNGTVYTPKEYTWVDNTVNRTGKYQYRLKQIDTDGDFEYSDAVEVVFEAPKSFELSQNYPNPFNPSTRISFTVPVDSRVKISVFNAVGELIKVLEDGIREAGYHSVVFDAASLPSGMYYYRLEAGDFVQSRKMLLIK